MVLTQAKSKRKPSSSRYNSARRKRCFEAGRRPVLPKLGEKKAKTVRTLGGASKICCFSNNMVNVYDKKAKKAKNLKILAVIDNPANMHYVRRNILTKGTIVKTELGNARITSKPGQEGCINAVLLSE